MRVGDYVRFKTLSNEIKIGRIIEIDNKIYNLDNNEVTIDKYILKSSPNIIDLIEVGDYVNGYKVDDIEIIQNQKIIVVTINEAEYISENNIKSIVTSQQFSSMEYKVGE